MYRLFSYQMRFPQVSRIMGTNVEYRQHNFRPNFPLPTVSGYHWQNPKSEANQFLHSVNYQRCDLREALIGLNFWTCLRFRVLQCEMCFDWKLIWPQPRCSQGKGNFRGRNSRLYIILYHFLPMRSLWQKCDFLSFLFKIMFFLW